MYRLLKQPTIIISLLSLTIAALSCVLTMTVLAPLIEHFIVASENTAGGQGNIWGTIIMLPVILAWGVSLVSSRPVISVGLLLIAFPFLGRTRDYLFIGIYQSVSPDGWLERLGLSSLFIVVLFTALLLRKVQMRYPASKLFRTVEACLWLFAGFGTTAQFFHHDIITAILLSFNGMWQYLLWFYVLIGAARRIKDVKLLFACFSGMLLANILLRFLFSGVLYDIGWAEGGYYAYRYYASGLGWSGNYSILLVIAIIFNVGLLSLAKGVASKTMWLMFSVFQGIELAFTFMRGAYLVFLLACLIMLGLRATRLYTTMLLVTLGVAVLVAVVLIGDATYAVLTARIMFLEEDLGRWQLVQMAIRDLLHDVGFGFGIFKEPEYLAEYYVRSLPVHNSLLMLAQSVGLWSALAWGGATVATMIGLTQYLRRKKEVQIKKVLVATLTVALFGWFIFANISGTYLTQYYPLESTQGLYMLIGLSIGFLNHTDCVKSGCTVLSS